MKRLIIMVAIAALFVGCIGCVTTKTVYTEECTTYAEVGATAENSVICAKISNPCAVQKLLATAAKAPVIWQQREYVAMFEEWAGKIQILIEEGITYQLLQETILVQIARLNREAGLALLLVSDGIFVFEGQTQLIGEIDQKLLLMSLEDLRNQVKRMGILAQ